MNPEPNLKNPAFAETPLEAIDGTELDRVIVGDRTFVIARPGNSDQLFKHPAVRAENATRDYMPYWTDLWPAARMLGKALLREDLTPGLRALEIGCGLGLPGIVALSRGLAVTFSDFDQTALHFAARNARANGFQEFELLPVDWYHPPTDRKFDVVLGSDLIYEIRNVAPLVDLIRHVLEPAGVCLLTDQDRVPSHVLRQTLDEQGLHYTTQVMHAGEPGGQRARGTLYRIRTVSYNAT
jgi:predicted nicotinamide N-methyase